MDYSFSLSFDNQAMPFAGADGAKRLATALKRGIVRGADLVKKQISNNAGGDILHRRTGLLARSFKVGEVESNADGLSVSVYNDATGISTGGADITYSGRTPYADIQETGGTITSKKGMLAIPVGPALTSAGVARFKSPRDVPGLALAMPSGLGPHSGSASYLMLGKSTGGRNSRFEAWFILKKSVTIPATHYITRGFEDSKDRAVDQIQTQVEQAINAETTRAI